MLAAKSISNTNERLSKALVVAAYFETTCLVNDAVLDASHIMVESDEIPAHRRLE